MATYCYQPKHVLHTHTQTHRKPNEARGSHSWAYGVITVTSFSSTIKGFQRKLE